MHLVSHRRKTIHNHCHLLKQNALHNWSLFDILGPQVPLSASSHNDVIAQSQYAIVDDQTTERGDSSNKRKEQKRQITPSLCLGNRTKWKHRWEPDKPFENTQSNPVT
uniref:Uncharacterized protein n=1 Tax=Opuntia streptacantha TaxID=393608 RepID=A0A7C9AAU8_OPUST